jgi:glycosyltransferase involved in cell wall biosynthesis
MKNVVSIIVPCYNQAQFLDEALQSVLDQTHADWECIIVNDGSRDHTEELAQKWIDKDSRFVYVYKENGGLSSARNAGLAAARGAYIQFLDSDDFIATTKLELSLQQIALDKNKDLTVVISNFRMFVSNPQHTSEPYCNLKSELFTFESVLCQWEESFTIPIHCGFFDAVLFESFRFPENLKAKEDWVMWVSLFYKNCQAAFLNQPLALYRRNPHSMTTTKDMLPDFMKACDYFRDFLPAEMYHDFFKQLISRYYASNKILKKTLSATKNSYSYQTGLMVKKVLKTLGVLGLFKRIFPVLLRFKTK